MLFAAFLQLAAPAFEAASVKRREPGGPPAPMRMRVTPGRISFQSVVLKDTIRWAYGLADYQVLGGPAWLAGPLRWDLEATAGRPATDRELGAMFRALLAERFGSRATSGSTEMNVMVLASVKPGPNLRRTPDDVPRNDDWRFSPLFQQNKPGPGSTTLRVLSAQRATMRYFAEYLSRQFRLPVLDRTGLEGDFGFTLEYPADAVGPGADMFGATGREAQSDQLGMTLTSTRAPVETLTIDAVREASPN